MNGFIVPMKSFVVNVNFYDLVFVFLKLSQLKDISEVRGGDITYKISPPKFYNIEHRKYLGLGPSVVASVRMKLCGLVYFGIFTRLILGFCGSATY